MSNKISSLQERLYYLIDSKRLSSYRISQDTGVSEATLSNILNGKTKKLSRSTLDALSNYFNIRKEWLQTGTGEIQLSENDTVLINRDVLKTIISQQETIHSQQKMLEKLINANDQKNARPEDLAGCADATGA